MIQSAPDGRGDTTLLVADPDASYLAELAVALEREGVRVIGVADGAQALLTTGAEDPDMLLVSADLPVIGAVEFIRTVRKTRAVPVLLGIGEGNAELAVRALAVGATACVARPYRMPELMPLIQAAAHEEHAPRPVVKVGHIELNTTSYQVHVSGELVHLPLREFELLHFLMRNVDRIVTREQITRYVWSSATPAATNTIAVHLKRLRARLNDHDDHLIQTVRGVGYRMVSPRPH
ncbi:response regulator transcription factor [Acrocarpospora catenulata]|uniref:response regulator transcription factor n=1 Tax=Acrocarpospora catenulata TaxID=2836182 RepID=UPI001BD9572D|nr:response regulator transcription factor [Acrocarpospora catenulata]